MIQRRSIAFTLVEVLVATFIFSLLILGLYLIFSKVYRAWEKGNARLEQYQTIRGCLDILGRDLKSAFVTSSNPFILFKGNKDEILFTSSSNIPSQKGEYDLKQIQYKLEGSRLLRKVKSNFSTLKPCGSVTVLASDIDKLTFSYYNGERWLSHWDSRKSRGKKFSAALPQAVCIELVVKEEDEMPLTFSARVNIPLR